jgi:hypothetical protein
VRGSASASSTAPCLISEVALYAAVGVETRKTCCILIISSGRLFRYLLPSVANGSGRRLSLGDLAVKAGEDRAVMARRRSSALWE